MKASNRSSTRSATMRRLASRHLDLLALVPGFGELECTHQGARTRHRAMLRCHGIESQLLAFAQGMRQNDISEQMRTIARQLTPEEMHAVAAYYGGGL